MKTVWYDTKSGIRNSIQTLDGFHDLVEARHEAGYDRGERLDEFCILGRYWLDTCGNLGVMTEDRVSTSVPKDCFPHIPDVLTKEELYAFLHLQPGMKIHFGRNIRGGHVATPGVCCAICERTWTMADAHECVTVLSDELFDLTDFVGWSFGQFREALGFRTDALYSIQPELEIRNDTRIDRSSTTRDANGWTEHGTIEGDYIIQEGDETLLNVWHLYHPTCYRNMLAERKEKEFLVLLDLAGYEEFTMKQVENKYGSERYLGPWFEVKTSFGTLVIGWRKRVIEITWSGTGRDLLDLFEDVANTKSAYHIHAWGYKQAIEYLRRLREALSAPPANV